MLQVIARVVPLLEQRAQLVPASRVAQDALQRREGSRVERAEGSILEFPVATLQVLGRNLPVGGGGYFRLLPGAITRAALEDCL